MTYNPLTDDILIAVEAAQERARTCRQDDGTWQLPHLLSGFDLHPGVIGALITDQVETHRGRLKAGADLDRVLTSAYVSALLVGLFIGETRAARGIVERGAA